MSNKLTCDSYPYISGNGFRNRAHYVLDQYRQDSPNIIKKDGEVCFIKTDFVQDFFLYVLPKINSMVNIITHNSAYGLNYAHLMYLENKKIIKWWGQNANIYHPKLESIPVGLSNCRWEIGDIDVLKEVMEMKLEKKHLLYLNFNPSTNFEKRKLVYDKFKNESYVYNSERKKFKEYLIDIAQSKYVISPPGMGEDCCRIWESLYLESIPIVMESHNISFYKDLPIMIIKSWDEVNEKSLTFLENYYKIGYNKEDEKKLYLNYWIERINLKPAYYQLVDKDENLYD